MSIQNLSDSERHTFMIGMLAKQWAVIESNMDFVAQFTFYNFGGNAIEDEVPRALGRKIKFLRKTISLSELAKPFSKAAVSLLDEASASKEFRHECIHGITYLGQTDFPFDIYVLDRRPNYLGTRDRTITEDDMLSATREASFIIYGLRGLLFQAVRWSNTHSRSESPPPLLPLLNQMPPATPRERRIVVAARELLSC